MNRVKRLFDFSVALVALLILSLPMMVVTVLVCVKLGRPVFFRQVRVGKNAKPFMMYKFRTMLDTVDVNGEPLPDAQRITKFGSALRSSSLDELPGLWNVLKGEMSLVGPRPLLVEYVPLYSTEQAKRHIVLPGITGWAQVNGRNALSWERKFELDVWYVERQSLLLDLKILALTVKKILIKEGINAEGEVTMSKFTGSGNSGR